MSDIYTRLLLDTKDFESKLGKAKNSTNDFSSNISGKVVGAVGKFAAGLGIAVSATESLERVMKSSQTTSDKYAETMEGLKSSVNAFFTAISTGDFSSFHTGLDGIISRARNAYRALDQLGNSQMSFTVGQALNQREISEGQLSAKNKFAPTDVRVAGFDRWRGGIKATEEQSIQLANDTKNAIMKAVEASANVKHFTANMDNTLMAVLLDIQNEAKRSEYKKKYEKEYKEYQEAVSEAVEIRNRESVGKNASEKMLAENKYNSTLQSLANQYNEAITVNALLVKENDEYLKQVGGNIVSMVQLDSSIANLKREFNETANEYNNANKGTAGFNAIKSFDGYTVYSGSSEASKNFKGTSSSGKGKAKVEFPVVIPQVQYDTELGMKVLQWMSGKDIQPIKVPIEIEEENIDEEAIPKKVKENKEYQYSVLDVADAIGSLTGTFSAGASTAASYFSNVVSGVLQASAAIASLIPLKKMEANANAEVAVTGAAASAASTPIVGWLMAGAAVASVIAAMANIPKFAEGGVVGGSSFIGDKLIARVNSGETILTQKQAARALSMMEGGNNVRVTGDVRLSGKDIYVSLRNYMKSSGNKL